MPSLGQRCPHLYLAKTSLVEYPWNSEAQNFLQLGNASIFALFSYLFERYLIDQLLVQGKEGILERKSGHFL
jgi:hypothetical protein